MCSPARGGELQDHRPIGQVGLRGQEDPARAPRPSSASSRNSPSVSPGRECSGGERPPSAGGSRGVPAPASPIAGTGEKLRGLRPPPVSCRSEISSYTRSSAASGWLPQVRVAVQILLGRRPFSLLPALHHLLCEVPRRCSGSAGRETARSGPVGAGNAMRGPQEAAAQEGSSGSCVRASCLASRRRIRRTLPRACPSAPRPPPGAGRCRAAAGAA